MCKIGMIRILANYTDAKGKEQKVVVCGSVRTPARKADNTYEYLNPDSYS